MNLQEIRQKYPQYDDLSDEKLLQGFHSKYYSDMSYDDFIAKIGVSPANGPAEVPGPAGEPGPAPVAERGGDSGGVSARVGGAVSNIPVRNMDDELASIRVNGRDIPLPGYPQGPVDAAGNLMVNLPGLAVSGLSGLTAFMQGPKFPARDQKADKSLIADRYRKIVADAIQV